MSRNAMVPVIIAILCVPAVASEKADLKDTYEKKYLVVLRDGLAVGQCAEHQANYGHKGIELPSLTVRVEGDHAEYHEQTGLSAVATECGAITPEPLHKGEVLFARNIHIGRGEFIIFAQTVSPHQTERGLGAFEHASFEQGAANLRFKGSPGEVDAVVSMWLKPFDSQDEAAKFGNTASGVYVKQVKLGMSFAEVEAALGPPLTRADLGEKVLYKYKDMTVEFHDGKVTDVR